MFQTFDFVFTGSVNKVYEVETVPLKEQGER
jgi:hypothetical protein